MAYPYSSQSAAWTAGQTITAAMANSHAAALNDLLAELGTNPSTTGYSTVQAAIEAAIAASAGFTRQTAVYTSASLDGGEDEVGTVALAISYRILRVATSRPARVRLHTTSAKRDLDRSRPSTTDPAGDHGIAMEVITTGAVLSVDIPQIIGSSLESTPVSAIPITVDNRDTATGTVVVTLTWQREE